MAFTVTSRMLMLINTCINPIIYATTIPEFKEILKAFFRCNRTNKLEEIGQDTKEVPMGWNRSMPTEASCRSSPFNCLSSPQNVDATAETVFCNEYYKNVSTRNSSITT